MVVGLCQVALERDDLAAATSYLTRLDSLGEHLGLPQNPYRSRVARAGLLQAEGDLAGAVALLDEAERVYVGDFSPNVRPVPAQRARVLVAQGRLDEALAWAREQHLEPDDDLHYIREYEHITLARILMHQENAGRAARGLLDRLGYAAEEGGRSGSLIEILTLQALAHHAEHGRHDVPGAVEPLDRALRLAEPEGYMRVFLGEGAAMATLLEAVARRNPSWAYPRRLIDAFDRRSEPAAPVDQGLVDPLSARELDVLRLLATDLGGPAIARELAVSLNTVRTHTKNVYAKLGVNSRRAAVTRAGELGLLARTPN